MARVTYVKKCRKPQGNCGRCGDPINAGDPYRHFSPGFRASKRVRCMKSECSPRPSDLTANDRLQRLYGAQESVEDFLGDWDRLDVEDVKSALQDALNTIEEVKDEYQESADAINETAEGSPIAEECEEKVSQLEDWHSQIESCMDELEEFEPEEDDEDEEPEGEDKPAPKEVDTEADDPRRDQWADEIIEKASEAMGECPL